MHGTWIAAKGRVLKQHLLSYLVSTQDSILCSWLSSWPGHGLTVTCLSSAPFCKSAAAMACARALVGLF
jgi:hypothetical protein